MPSARLRRLATGPLHVPLLRHRIHEPDSLHVDVASVVLGRPVVLVPAQDHHHSIGSDVGRELRARRVQRARPRERRRTSRNQRLWLTEVEPQELSPESVGRSNLRGLQKASEKETRVRCAGGRASVGTRERGIRS